MDWRTRLDRSREIFPVKKTGAAAEEGAWTKVLVRQMIYCGVILLAAAAVKFLMPNQGGLLRQEYKALSEYVAVLPGGANTAEAMEQWVSAGMERFGVPEELRQRVREELFGRAMEVSEQKAPNVGEEGVPEGTKQAVSGEIFREAAVPAMVAAEKVLSDIEGEKDAAGAGGALTWRNDEIPAACTMAPLTLTVPLKDPLKGAGRITSEYGWREHPITGNADFHRGLDLGAPGGTDIYAVKSGVVVERGISEVYGKYITIAHSGELFTTYAHCSSIDLEEGDWISAGGRIGAVGSTGLSSGNHLHFEVRQGEIYYDPETGMEPIS